MMDTNISYKKLTKINKEERLYHKKKNRTYVW